MHAPLKNLSNSSCTLIMQGLRNESYIVRQKWRKLCILPKIIERHGAAHHLAEWKEYVLHDDFELLHNTQVKCHSGSLTSFSSFSH